MRIDPHNHKEKYIGWRESANSIKSISEINKNLILNYLDDMAKGANIMNHFRN